MDMLNDKKIAFIICANNAEALNECCFYLDRLVLPEGMEKDVITVQEAPSMAAGYNAGMNSSDAKYKVYLHQDLWIVNEQFVPDVLRIFQSEPKIGILGCVGAVNLGKEAMAVTAWDTGKIMQNGAGVPVLLELDDTEGDYTKVKALDGQLLATQYDILWREDIMDGWDFYDVSQCMEFMRSGYEAAVPRQKKAWCFHDCMSSKMTNYNFYRKRFIDEYVSDGLFEMPPIWEGGIEYHRLKQQSVEMMERLVQEGKRNDMQEFFRNKENRDYLHLKEFEVISDIDYLEQNARSKKLLWQNGMDMYSLLNKMRQLKYWVKRMEHQAVDAMQMMDQVMAEYSIYAVAEIFTQYVVYKKYTYHQVKEYLYRKQLVQEAEVWDRLNIG